jgi:ribosomal-protein-alanine N-acetyltransferase
MRPDLTGQGLGVEYLLAGLESARERFSPERFSLSVATFNERAGFRRGNEFMHNTNDGEYLFLSMVREA